MERILLVEDDRAMAAMIAEYLGLEGFHVDAVHDGAAPAADKPAGYDLVVLDVMLPNRSGFDVLKSLRRGYATPVILLTARDNETDCVLGLELGADDYVTKPFSIRELMARVKAVLRRAGPQAPAPEKALCSEEAEQAATTVAVTRIGPQACVSFMRRSPGEARQGA